jgi:hypothetical protein
MELSGILKVIGDTKAYGRNDFLKREVVITTEEQYPQSIIIEFVKDKCALLDRFAEGQRVDIGINLRGREWVSPQGETKYFNTIQGWKIFASNDTPQQEPEPQNQEQELPNKPELPSDEEEEDDLPF